MALSDPVALGELIYDRRSALGITQAQLAGMLKCRQQAVSEIENGQKMSQHIGHLDEIAKILSIGKEVEDFKKARFVAAQENIRRRIRDARSSVTAPRLPVFGQAAGGSDGEYHFNGTVVDYVGCPPGLEDVPDAYAVYVDGESMSPRYGPRDTVWVHPGKPPRSGDDVVVQIEGAGHGHAPRGFIKRFVGWTDKSLRLHQFNPDKELTFPRGKVVSVHPVVFIRPA